MLVGEDVGDLVKDAGGHHVVPPPRRSDEVVAHLFFLAPLQDGGGAEGLWG